MILLNNTNCIIKEGALKFINELMDVLSDLPQIETDSKLIVTLENNSVYGTINSEGKEIIHRMFLPFIFNEQTNEINVLP